MGGAMESAPVPVPAAASSAVSLPTRLIIDTDPGIDDVAAIVPLLAAPEVDVRLIATVSGNVDVDRTTRNARAVLAYLREHAADRDASPWWRVPVARGAARPLLREPVYAPAVHGGDGVGGFPLPEPDAGMAVASGTVAEPDAAVLGEDAPSVPDGAGDAAVAEARVLAQAAADGTAVDILALGPLTNVARLLRDHPAEARAIRRIVLMGGSFGPRYDWACDFNIAVDPEAAAIVFGSGLPIVMVGVEIGRKATLPPDALARLDAQGPAGHMVAAMFASYDDGAVVSGPGVQMYDPTTALYLLEPDLFVTARAHVGVDVLDPPEEPAALKSTTAVDFDAEPSGRRNVTVAIDIDVERFRTAYLRRMAAVDALLS